MLTTIAGVVAYDHPQMGKVYLLVFHQAIFPPNLNHHLLCPMPCRLNHVTINETLKFLVHDLDESTHAILADDPLGKKGPLVIPLSIEGVNIYFHI